MIELAFEISYMEKANFFGKESISIVPRVLGLIDRNSKSHTFGCSDRNYWHYLLHDFPNARLHDTMWLLTLVYNLEEPNNRFSNNSKIAEWALGIVKFWAKIQHENGAFDEVYPYEYSYCATAFSTWWAGETYLELQEIGRDLNESEKLITPTISRLVTSALKKAGKWLIKHNNLQVANQEAAAAVALKAIALITNNKNFEEGAKIKINQIISKQHPEGYYPEYDGPDIGYHSLSLSCLATYRKHSETLPELNSSLYRAVQFLETKIDENGLYEWWRTSRRTQYLYPYGLAACWDEGGKQILERYMLGLSKDYVIRPSWMDDRYCTYMAIDYLRTYKILLEKFKL